MEQGVGEGQGASIRGKRKGTFCPLALTVTVGRFVGVPKGSGSWPALSHSSWEYL